jgi:hypothetical protein
MGIKLTPSITHYLQVKDRSRARRIARSKLSETKKSRVQKKNDTLKHDEAQARKERAKRDGTYKRGMNMDEGGADGCTAEDLAQPKQKKQRKVNKDIICKHCKLKGHSTTRSRACLMNKDYVPKPEPNNTEDTAAAAAAGIDIAAAHASDG